MKISVIIPCYNVEKFIRRSLNSLITQSYTNWEAILVDDGSGDTTPDICNEYIERDDRFKYYRKMNGGVSSARNLGLDNATGDIVCFMDPDDWFSPDAIEIICNAFTDADVDGFEYQFGWAYDEKLLTEERNGDANYKRYSGHEDVVGYYFRKIDWTQDDLNYWFKGGNIWSRFFPFGMCRFAFRRELIEQHKIRLDVSKVVYEDKDFILRCIFLCRNMVSTPLCTYAYYMNPDSATHKRITFHDRLNDKCLLFDSYQHVREYNNLFDTFPYYFGAMVISCMSLLPKIKSLHDISEYCKYMRRKDVNSALGLMDMTYCVGIKRLILLLLKNNGARFISSCSYLINIFRK